MRSVTPVRNYVNEETISRVVSGDYLENHPVDAVIIRYLKPLKVEHQPPSEDIEVVSPS